MKKTRKQKTIRITSVKTIPENHRWLSWSTVSMCCLGLSILWLRYLSSTKVIEIKNESQSVTTVQSYVPRLPKVSYRRWNVTCSNHYRPFIAGCHQRREHCARVVYDDFLSAAEINHLHSIADVGMTGRSTLGGPTIMDMNSGFVKDGAGLINIYESKSESARFTKQDHELYKRYSPSLMR